MNVCVRAGGGAHVRVFVRAFFLRVLRASCVHDRSF
jgi:hypothetical protein